MGGNYVLILLLSFLVACQPYIQAVPTAQHQGAISIELSDDACATIICPTGQLCDNGDCVCPSGEKLCNGNCIDEDACCRDDDCDSGDCENGECGEAPECKYGEVLENGECKCADDKIFCHEQGKCIDRGDCCVHSQCPNFERCVETNFRTSLCAKVDEKKVCKILADKGRTELYEIKGNKFRVGALKWLSDGSIEFNISNQTIRLAENAMTTVSNVTLFHEGIEITGGFCKEDEDD